MLVILLCSVSQEEQQDFTETTTLVGTCSTLSRAKEVIEEHSEVEYNEGYELDWDLWEDSDTVQINYTDDDNDMLELGYVVLGHEDTNPLESLIR